MRKRLHVQAVVGTPGNMMGQSSVRLQEKITVLSDGPLRPALIEMGDAFRRQRGGQVACAFGPSPVIHKKVADGETADVLIIQPHFVGALVQAGKVVPGEPRVVGRVGVGLAVRADAPAWDISTTDAFKHTLLHADAVIFNNVTSGDYVATVLERLGIAETVQAKVRRLDPLAVYDRVMQGKGCDIGVEVIPLINAMQDVRLLGPLPAEVQQYMVYAAAQITSSTSPQGGTAFIDFLASPAATAAFAAHGVE